MEPPNKRPRMEGKKDDRLPSSVMGMSGSKDDPMPSDTEEMTHKKGQPSMAHEKEKSVRRQILGGKGYVLEDIDAHMEQLPRMDMTLWDGLQAEAGRKRTQPRCLGCIDSKRGKCSGPPACTTCLGRGVQCTWALMADRATVMKEHPESITPIAPASKKAPKNLHLVGRKSK